MLAAGVCSTAQAARAPERFIHFVRVHHPCMAGITEAPEGTWDVTVDYGGGHGNTSESYGIWQANPGSKMAWYSYTNGGHRAGELNGRDWATDPWTQLRWAINYAVGRYGSECAALAFRRAHGYW